MTSHFVTTFKVNSEARSRGIVFEQELLSVQCIVILVHKSSTGRVWLSCS